MVVPAVEKCFIGVHLVFEILQQKEGATDNVLGGESRKRQLTGNRVTFTFLGTE